jgi:hypothetical protein
LPTFTAVESTELFPQVPEGEALLSKRQTEKERERERKRERESQPERFSIAKPQ